MGAIIEIENTEEDIEPTGEKRENLKSSSFQFIALMRKKEEEQ